MIFLARQNAITVRIARSRLMVMYCAILLLRINLWIGADKSGHFRRCLQVGMAHDEIAVGNEGLFPVAARRPVRQQVDMHQHIAEAMPQRFGYPLIA